MGENNKDNEVVDIEDLVKAIEEILKK